MDWQKAGSAWGSRAVDWAYTRVHFRRLVELARGGDVRPQVSSTFALVEIAEAQEEFSARRHIGKIVILPR